MDTKDAPPWKAKWSHTRRVSMVFIDALCILSPKEILFAQRHWLRVLLYWLAWQRMAAIGQCDGCEQVVCCEPLER